jgi:DNA polymerase IV
MIVHVDMDAFFASVEQNDNPEFKEKPVIIGVGKRGVVSAASYEARKFGIHSAMPVVTAKKLCPHGIFLPPRLERYSEVSGIIMEILTSFSPVVEKASIDEAYIDISGTEKLFGSPIETGGKIKNEIYNKTGLKCSVGIAPVKFLAKIASDWKKPDGLFIIYSSEVNEFLYLLPVKKIGGIGKKFVDILKQLDVTTCEDVLKFSEEFWNNRFGKRGVLLFQRSKGIDKSKVKTSYLRKSISSEKTLEKDIKDKKLIKSHLLELCENVGNDLRNHNLKGKTISLKIKFSDFEVITRSYTLNSTTSNTILIYETIISLYKKVKIYKSVRLMGVKISNFENTEQLSLFEEESKIDKTMDLLNKKFGKGIIKHGGILTKKKAPENSRS